MLLGRDQTTQMLRSLDFDTPDEAGQLAILADFPSLLEMVPRDHGSIDFYKTTGWSTLHANDSPHARWPLPTPEALRSAENARNKIDSAPFDTDRMFYIAGQGITIDRIMIERRASPADNAILFSRTPAGDGRVTWKTGILPGMRAWYSSVAHGDLARDEQTISATLDLLQSGATDRLPSAAPSMPDLEIKPVEKERMEIFPNDPVLTAAAIGAGITRPVVARTEPVRVTVVHGNLAFAGIRSWWGTIVATLSPARRHISIACSMVA